jgi:hypothetical protein
MRRLRLKLLDKPKTTPSIPHVAKFIHSQASAADPPKPALSLALVEFHESSAWLTLFPSTPPGDRTMRRHNLNVHDNAHHEDDNHRDSNDMYNEISIHVSCGLLGDQLSALTSICSALARHTLSSITELMLGFHAHRLPTTPSTGGGTQQKQQKKKQQQRDAAQTLSWLALLVPFRSVRTLRVDAALGAEIARALRTWPGVENGGRARERERGGGGECDRERPETPLLLLPALRAVEPLYHQVVSAPAGLPASSSAGTHAVLLKKLAERNRRIAAARLVVVETH